MCCHPFLVAKAADKITETIGKYLPLYCAYLEILQCPFILKTLKLSHYFVTLHDFLLYGCC